MKLFAGRLGPGCRSGTVFPVVHAGVVGNSLALIASRKVTTVASGFIASLKVKMNGRFVKRLSPGSAGPGLAGPRKSASAGAVLQTPAKQARAATQVYGLRWIILLIDEVVIMNDLFGNATCVIVKSWGWHPGPLLAQAVMW
jgi:hypothetical protein